MPCDEAGFALMPSVYGDQPTVNAEIIAAPKATAMKRAMIAKAVPC